MNPPIILFNFYNFFLCFKSEDKCLNYSTMPSKKIFHIFISILYGLTILVSAKESESSLLYYTVVAGEKNSQQNTLLSFINSTSIINSVAFLNLNDNNIAYVSKNSELTLHCCSISYFQAPSSFFLFLMEK